MLVLLPGHVPPPIGIAVRAVWLAALTPDTTRSGVAGRFGFVPDTRPDEVDGSTSSMPRDRPACCGASVDSEFLNPGVHRIRDVQAAAAVQYHPVWQVEA